MNANLSIAAAHFRCRPRKGRLRGLEAAVDRQFEPWLSELALGTSVNPTFKVGFSRDEHENRNG
jgi:hypothetical protein